MQGLTRTLHPPVKYEGNPILQPEKSWEKIPPKFKKNNGPQVQGNGTIIQDPVSGQWRMYYSAMMWRKCLAVSKDLLHWERPVLNQVEFEGSTENNIVFEDLIADTASVICDEREKDPARRWKAVLYHYRHGNNQPEGMYAWFSPDGLRWTMDPNPIMNSWIPNPGMKEERWTQSWPMPGIGDVNALSWDSKLNCFVAYIKVATYRDGKFFRTRGMCESNDFIHWTEPRLILIPDEDDPEDLHLYGNTGWPYESIWLGTLRAYHETYGNVDFQLISSRDGRNWQRAGERQSFIPNGPIGSYDEGYHTEFTNPPIPVGDELWFFYGSTTTSGKNADRNQWIGTINLAKLRKDGFVSLDAGENEGWVITRPLLFEGKNLFINADAEGGEIKVEVLDFDFRTMPPPAAKPIPGFSASGCQSVCENGLKLPVRWKDQPDLSSLAGQHVRLKFLLKNARLYSFAIR